MDDPMSPPFATLSERDHGPLILVETYIFLIISFLACTVKLWTRLSTARTLIATDWVMIGAIALNLTHSIVLTVAVNNGLGKRASELSRDQLDALSQAFYAASILGIMILAAAKCSVILLMVSIQTLRSFCLTCYALLGLIVAWAVAGVIALAFQCQAPAAWVLGGSDGDSCGNQFALQVVLGVFNILTDIMIVGLPYAMMHGVRVDMSRKLTIVCLFGLRLTTPPFVICALAAWHMYYTSDPAERPWNAVAPTLWSQVVITLSIITSCIPSIKKFLSDIQSGLMGATISEQYELTHSGGKATQLQSSNVSANRSRVASKYGGWSSRSHGASGVRRSQLRSRMREEELEFGGAQEQSNMARIRGGRRDGVGHDTESVKGLTQNVILQRVDVDVDFEESSDGRTSR